MPGGKSWDSLWFPTFRGPTFDPVFKNSTSQVLQINQSSRANKPRRQGVNLYYVLSSRSSSRFEDPGPGSGPLFKQLTHRNAVIRYIGTDLREIESGVVLNNIQP
jgi:hypothetical protein